MSRKWEVTPSEYGAHDWVVTAADCKIEGGALVFRDDLGRIIEAYGAYVWHAVRPVK